MAINPHESDAEFIRRAETLPELPGPYHDVSEPLVAAIAKSPDAMVVVEGVAGDTRLSTGQVTFQYDQEEAKDRWGRTYLKGGKTAKALVTKIDDGKGAFDELRVSYQLHFDDDIDTHDMFNFTVTPDGHIEGLSPTADVFLLSDKGALLVRQALVKVASHVAKKQETIERQRQQDIARRRDRRVRAARRISGGILALGVAGGATYGGVWMYDHYVTEPREAAEQARKAYDAQNHMLEDEGVPLERAKVGEMPKDAFAEIPEYKGGRDNLSDPRTIEMKGNSCKTIEDISPSVSQEVHAAVPEGSKIAGSWLTAIMNEGGHLRFCIDGPGTGDDTVDIALQLQKDAVLK